MSMRAYKRSIQWRRLCIIRTRGPSSSDVLGLDCHDWAAAGESCCGVLQTTNDHANFNLNRRNINHSNYTRRRQETQSVQACEKHKNNDNNKQETVYCYQQRIGLWQTNCTLIFILNFYINIFYYGNERWFRSWSDQTLIKFYSDI